MQDYYLKTQWTKLRVNGDDGLVSKTYAVEDIFEDIPEDDTNVLMNIPPEIAEQLGWKPGDVLRVKVLESGGVSIEKVNDGEE
jgi:AbrB family looped-hinge helix DNA binding protein